MPLGPRGTEDFGSWAAQRQGVRVPHLVKAAIRHWGCVEPLLTYQAVENDSADQWQSLQERVFFFFPILGCPFLWCRIQAKNWTLAFTGVTPVCGELAARPGSVLLELLLSLTWTSASSPGKWWQSHQRSAEYLAGGWGIPESVWVLFDPKGLCIWISHSKSLGTDPLIKV